MHQTLSRLYCRNTLRKDRTRMTKISRLANVSRRNR
jgi:hypothetical protein